MILDSVLGNQNLPSSETILVMMACSTAVYVIVCPVAFLIVRFLYRGVSKSARGAHAFLIAFGNTGFIGFAVLDAVFGADAVLFGAISNSPYNLVLRRAAVYHEFRRCGRPRAGRRVPVEADR